LPEGSAPIDRSVWECGPPNFRKGTAWCLWLGIPALSVAGTQDERSAMKARSVRQTSSANSGARVALGQMSVGAVGLGALAAGATAIGALAIGALAIRKLAVKRGRIERLEIDELEVGRLRVRELVVEQEQATRSTPA